MSSKKKTRKLKKTRNTTGYRGVVKNGKRFTSNIHIDRIKNYIGTYDTAKEAALAYDRAVVHYKLSSSKLNYPDAVPAPVPTKEYKPSEKGVLSRHHITSSGPAFAAHIKRGPGKYCIIGNYVKKIDAITALFYEDLRCNYNKELNVDHFTSIWKPTEVYHPTRLEEVRIHELGGMGYLVFGKKEDRNKFTYWFGGSLN